MLSRLLLASFLLTQSCCLALNSQELDQHAMEQCYGNDAAGGYAAAAALLEASAYQQLREAKELYGPGIQENTVDELISAKQQWREALDEWVLVEADQLKEVDGFLDARYYKSMQQRLQAVSSQLAQTMTKLCYAQQNDAQRLTPEHKELHQAYDYVTRTLLSFAGGEDAVRQLAEFRYNRLVFLQAYDSIVAGDEVAVARATIALLPELQLDSQVSYFSSEMKALKHAQLQNRLGLAILTLAQAEEPGYQLTDAVFTLEGALSIYDRVDNAAVPEVVTLRLNCINNLIWALLAEPSHENLLQAVQLTQELIRGGQAEPYAKVISAVRAQITAYAEKKIA